MPQNQPQKNIKLTGTSSSKKATNEKATNKKPNLQYRRSRNDDGNSDVSEEDGSDVEEFDKVEYAKLLAELFPSKYSVNKAKTLQQIDSRRNKKIVDSSSSSSEEEEEEKEEEEEEERYPRRSVRLQKQQQHKPERKERQERQERQEKQSVEKKDVVTKRAKEEFHPIKKQKYNNEESELKEEEQPGNYNIVINLQEPFDNLSDQYDDDDSALNDSVFDDESISSDQGESSGSDETYRDSDSGGDDDDSEGTESSYEEEQEEEEEVTTRGFRKNSASSSSNTAAAEIAEKADNISFTINGKSIFSKDKDGEEKDKKNDKKDDKKNDKKDNTGRDYEDEDEDEFGSEDEATIQTIKAQMEAILATDKNNKIARKTLDQMIEREEKIKRLRKKKSVKQMRSNTRKFGRLLQKKNSANDLKYFKKYLSHEQQAEVLKELGQLNKIMLVDKPYRLTLLESKIPQQYKAIALKRIQNLRYMDTCSGEYFKVKNWVDTFMTIPFGVHKTLPITMDVGVEQCHAFMEVAKDVLDSAVYGLNDAKMQIMQMVGQWISNPSALGSAIAIKGPPGTGKTTLVKEGISKILGRDFAFIALGGATDSSFLEGHSYTYEGSTWGKIVEILIRCKSMNPVIFFDELDKLSDTPKGEEITGILTHLTDTSQNSQFHDKYFSEIPFDLSKCLFIFSYNDESKVNPILLDRMYRIHTNGYAKKDKTHIAQKYLIPKIQSEVAFKPEQIIIPDETIEYIVEHHTNKEDGVRNLKRCLEIIFTKLNLYRLMKPGSKLFDKDSTSIDVTFPFTVTSSVVDMMIKKAETYSPPMFMYT
jgi:ATP-dependent Lon protease